MEMELSSHRIKLQNLLEDVLGSGNVYFQPPNNIEMKYPCIVYDISRYGKTFANNKDYLGRLSWSVTLITRDPESDIFIRLLEIPYISSETIFKVDNLYHHPFNLYF